MDNDDHDDLSEWHQRCRTRNCFCFCHNGYRVLRDMDVEIALARKQREFLQEPQSHYPGTKARAGARADGKCKNNHEMTEENTGPGNTCRRCKVLASNRCKEKKIAAAAAAAAAVAQGQCLQ